MTTTTVPQVIQNVLRFARLHGVVSYLADRDGLACVAIVIPWTMATGEEGEDVFLCSSISEARIALGY